MKQKVTKEQFFKLCEKYAKQNDALNTEEFENKYVWTYTVSFRILRVDFVFVRKGSFLIPKGTMFCRVYLKKSSEVFFLLSDILTTFFENDFRATFFYKVDAGRIEACFGILTGILDEYLPRIEKEVLEYQDEFIYSQLFDEYRRIFNLKAEDLDFSLVDDRQDENFYKFLYFQDSREDYILSRFANSYEYQLFIEGDTAKALKEYEKCKQQDLCDYEKKLIEFLKTPIAENFEPMPQECFKIKKTRSLYILDTNDSKKFFIYSLVAYVPCAAFFCLVCAVLTAIIQRGTLFAFSAGWYFGLLSAGLCAIFGGIAFRKTIAKLVEGKKAKQSIELDEMVNSKGVNIFANIVFVISAIFGLAMSIFIPSESVLFYEDRFKYCEETPYVFEECYYSEIDSVYHIDARYNDFGDRIDLSSYVVIMKNGKQIDFYGYTTDKNAEKTAIPLFKEKNIKIVFVDSDRNLPKQ